MNVKLRILTPDEDHEIKVPLVGTPIVGFPILELFWRRENPFFNQVKLATATTIMGVNCG